MAPEHYLQICFLTYRGNPSCGGQGIYTQRITRALADLGHHVEVWSGPPYPELDPRVPLRQLPSLDLWKDAPPLRRPTWAELSDPIHLSEWLRTVTGVFAEPLTFTRRAARVYRRSGHRFDIIHDNQSLGAGLLRLRQHAPVVATIHHPITVDRDIALAAAQDGLKRWGVDRWYKFIREQQRVAPHLDGVVTVSQAAAEGIRSDFHVANERMRVVPNGVDLDEFHPIDDRPRIPDRLISTISANAPLKGLPVLLEALALVRRTRPSTTLTIIGRDGHAPTNARIHALGLDGAVRFTGRLTVREMVEEYADASLAVVPSLYEGFGLPAIEAMACRVPVVSSSAGALPEVIGRDGEAGVLVPPGDSEALANAISSLLDTPERLRLMGERGRARVARHFTWRRAAELVSDLYRDVIDRRGRC